MSFKVPTSRVTRNAKVQGSNMRIIHDLDEMPETARGWLSGGIIGFIPTVGDLHAGHASLIHAARHECEYSSVSIFVNPLELDQDDAPVLHPNNLTGDIQSLGKE